MPKQQQQQSKGNQQQQQRVPPRQKRIIVKRNNAALEQRPSIRQRILRFITFLPLTILFLERLWIPFEGSGGSNGPLSGYYYYYGYYFSNEAAVSSTTFKSKQQQLTRNNSSSGLAAALVAAEYPLERIIIQQQQQHRQEQQQSSIAAIWSSSFGRLFGRTTSCPRGTQPLVSKTTVVEAAPATTSAATEPLDAVTTTQTRIPRIVHLPVASYCASPAVQDWVQQQWIQSLQNVAGSGTGGRLAATTTTTLYVHDVPSQERLLRLASVKLKSEFPQLSQLVRNNACLGQQQGDDENDGDAATTMASSELEELWKYMVLYLYGGLYANSHFVPYGLDPFPPSLPRDTDAIYFHETDDGSGSTFEPSIFMASPGHPLLYLALQYTIHDIVVATTSWPSSSSSSSSSSASPMERALVAFSGMSLEDLLAVRTPSRATTTIIGMHNRTVAIASYRETYFLKRPDPEAVVVSSNIKAKQQRHGVPLPSTTCRDNILAEIMGEAAAAARKR